MPVAEAPDDEGDQAPRQSYNFAPGYHGIVYRADVPDHGAGDRTHDRHGKEDETTTNNEEDHDRDTTSADDDHPVQYKLQSMRWGLIPFWNKRAPNYGSMMKTINCRDDSLLENKGMWNTMKQSKRCIVLAQGFYEWLKSPSSSRIKTPHFVKRKDGKLMCITGLWDCVRYEGKEEQDRLYTYTIITTDSNRQLRFLHDRMPCILENGEEVRIWTDSRRDRWSKELQGLLRPYEGELECYPVSQEVGKVGNNSPSFIIPVDSSENKSNIANFFGGGKKMGGEKKVVEQGKARAKVEEVRKEGVKGENVKTKEVKKEGAKGENVKAKEFNKEEAKGEDIQDDQAIKHEPDEDRKTIDHEGTEDNAPLPIPAEEEVKHGIKRELDDVPEDEPPKKLPKPSTNPPPKKKTPVKGGKRSRSATSNNTASPTKVTGKDKGSQKITSFFGGK